MEYYEIMSTAMHDFGFPVTMLGILIAAIWMVCKWVATNILKPGGEAFVEYLEKQTEATAEIIEYLRKTEYLDKEIKKAITEMKEVHKDEDSTFSTVHTNTSIEILCAINKRIAEKLGINIDDLAIEMTRVLKQQKS